jgi:hypothetical protein
MVEPEWDAMASLPLRDWAPQAQLRLAETRIPRSAVPAIDVHNHLGKWLNEGDWMIADVPALVGIMDATNVASIVNLDGMWGQEVSDNVERYDLAFPGRFFTFCQLDWGLLGEADGVIRLIASIDDSRARGARGLKVWKNLGLTIRDASGALVLPDDPRVVDVITHAGAIGLPVLIHTADPKAFFEPLDVRNERLDELMQNRDWWFGDPDIHPTFDRLLRALHTLVLACPGTTFIGAHVGCAAEDLELVESLLECAPNFTIDIGGRMAELGRQPRRFRELIARFPDRVLFGTDIFPASAEQYELHFRFLETADESFEYAPDEDIPPQGRWTVSGLALDTGTLTAIYADNARRVLGL